MTGPDHIHILRGATAKPLTRVLSTWSATEQELNHCPHPPEEVGQHREGEGESVSVGVCVNVFLFECKAGVT